MPGNPLDIAVLEEDHDFVALQGEWDNLYEDSPLATPFQSWAWLYSWWEHYGEGYELRLVTLRDGRGTLVGLLPLMLKRQPGFRRLLLLGDDSVSYKDILARGEWEDEVVEAGGQALREMGSWDVADLQELRPEALVWRLFQRWTGYRTQAWTNNYLTVEARPWEEILASTSKNQRKMARRSLRRIDEDAVQVRVAEPEDAAQAASRLVALHREMWQDREIDPSHLSEEFESHLRAVVQRITDADYGGVSEAWRDGEAIISLLVLWKQDFIGCYMLGASQAAAERYSISSVYIWDALNIARSKNGTYLSFMQGEEPYKLRWNPSRVPNDRVILGRRPVVWGIYAGYRILRSRARKYREDSFNPPPWAKDLARKFRVWRSKLLSLRYVKRVDSNHQTKKPSKRD